MIDDAPAGRTLDFYAANPEWTEERLTAIEAQERLASFVELMWPVLHPVRPLVKGWVLDALCEHLEALARGDIKKLLVNVPPGTMKSLAVDVFFPAWIWGPRARADQQFISWSYGEEITIRDNVRFRDVVTSDVYQRHWGDVFSLTGDQNEKRHIQNSRQGFKIARGIHGGGTGHRGDFLIIDDPHKVKEAESDARRTDANRWFAETFQTRKNDSAARELVIMQRIHEQDVSGTIISALDELGYEHLCLPMEWEPDHPHVSRTSIGFVDPRTEPGELLWPERFSREEVENQKTGLRLSGGDYAVAGQFQQRPAPRGGGMFHTDDFQIIDVPPDELRYVCRGWDLAATSAKKNPGASFTAGVKGGVTRDGRIVILDVARGQLTDYEVEQLLRQTAEHDGVRCPQDLPQDPGQSGVAQKRALARVLVGFTVHFGLESGEKSHRARPLAAQAAAGNLFLVRAPWNDALIREASVFPAGRFLDQIDAASRMFARLTLMMGTTTHMVKPELHVG